MATDADDRTARPAPRVGQSRWREIAGVLRHPHRGWQAIAATPASVSGLMLGVAVPLTLIGPAARLIRAVVFGAGSMGIIHYRATVGGAIVTTLVGWSAALAAVFLLSVAIDLSAPWFGGVRDRVAATKVAVFGASAWLIAGGFFVWPPIDILRVVGAYSMVLLFVGAPMLMRPPAERASLHGLSVAALAALLLVAALAVPAAVARTTLRPTVDTANGRIVVTGDPSIPGSTLTAPATDKSRAVAPGAGLAAGQTAVAASALQALLPARIGGFIRTTLESQSNLAAGVSSSDAKASYVEGTNSFTLTISDAGAPGALATTNSVIAGEVNRVTDNGYQRSQVINGVRIMEKWNNADHGGSYSRAVAGRFTVEAQGTAPNVDTLRGAVAAVDESRLAALGR